MSKESDDFTLSEQEIYSRLCIVLTLLSSLTCLFIIFAILLRIRNDLASRFTLYLCISNFLLSVVSLICCAYSHTLFTCKIETTLTWYFLQSSMLWVIMISVHSYQVVHYSYQILPLSQEIAANVICWTVPLISTLIPLYSDESYEQNEIWCSFTPRIQMMNIWIYYLPCLTIIVFCYTKISLEVIKSTVRTRSPSSKRKVVMYLFSFIFFFILIWSPFAFISLYEGVVEDANYFSLECIGNSLIYVQGTVHTFLYGINKELLDNIKKYLFQFNYDLRISLRQITLYDSPVVSPMASPPVSPPSTISSYYPETRVALP